ncbi:MAG TPA: SlyX family protein [Aliiroseovarius sp.]|nr:SlyX family protein [Aliiroseovarius sp.]
MTQTSITDLEETIAHLSRTVEELSDVVARQDRILDRVNHRIEMLMSREAERELESGNSVPLADEKPPHW